MSIERKKQPKQRSPKEKLETEQAKLICSQVCSSYKPLEAGSSLQKYVEICLHVYIYTYIYITPLHENPKQRRGTCDVCIHVFEIDVLVTIVYKYITLDKLGDVWAF